MRITTKNLTDFLANLAGRDVFADTVYVDCLEHALNGTSPQTASSWDVYFQVCAIVSLQGRDGDIGQALVACGEYCGVYSTTRNGTSEGRDRYHERRVELTKYCDEHGLRVQPGQLEI